MTRADRVLASAVEAIGNTPLVDLARLTKGMDGRILAKMEYLNPGLSKKDRIARQIIEEAEAQGDLKPGQTVVELTSGNTGTGLAIVCAIKGYPFVAVMSKGNSMERARMMSALGAEVVLVDQLPGSKPGQVSGGDLELVEIETRKIVSERSEPERSLSEHGTRDPPANRRIVPCLLRLCRHGRLLCRMRRSLQGTRPIHPMLSGGARGRSRAGRPTGDQPESQNPGRRILHDDFALAQA